MEQTRIIKKLSKHRFFVILVALAFWIWLAKDLVFGMLPVKLQTGQLLSITLAVLVLLFIAGKIENIKKVRTSQNFNLTLVNIFVIFFFYCVVSGYLSGDTAFTIFKLQNLLISMVVAYALAEKTIDAIVLDKRLFFMTGLSIGLIGYYSVFNDINDYHGFIGLRAKNLAHLNIQDFYVVLLLYATTLLFGGYFSRTHFILFLVTGCLCLPIIIGLNSRMIPFTIGVSFIYFAIALRTVILRYRNFKKYAFLITGCVIAALMIGNSVISKESRMMQIFETGPIKSFAHDPRSISFDKAIDDFLDSPVFGIGFGKFSYPGIYVNPNDRLSGTWPHNIFLELLSELGIIGFCLFAFPTGFLLKRVFSMKIKMNREYIAFPCLLLIYIFATMQFTQNIFYPFLWVGYFCTVAAFRFERDVFKRLRNRNCCSSSAYPSIK